MQVNICSNCGAKNRVDESRLAKSEAKCGRCGQKLESVAAGGADSKPVIVTDQTFEQDVFRVKGQPVLVDCWAPWCGPCRMVAPELERVAASNAGRYLVVKVNTDAVPELGERFRIRSIPTMAVFEGGREVARTSGARPAADIEAFVRQSVNTAQKRA